MKPRLIYVVDDELKIRELIKSYMLKEGFEVRTFSDGESALAVFREKPADMLVIDIMMPGIDGYTLCREIRKTNDVPIIMVSAKDDEIDRVLGLELGSDDYISKPFSPRELIARVKTIFRRIKDETTREASEQETAARNEIRCRDVAVFPDERRVAAKGNDIEFTSKEFDLLFYLIKNKNRVFTRENLLNGIWGYDFIGDTRAVDDLVKRARKKLVQAGSELEITTVWGYGYKISEQDVK